MRVSWAILPSGERNYFEFNLGKAKTPQKVGDVTLLLKKTDPKRLASMTLSEFLRTCRVCKLYDCARRQWLDFDGNPTSEAATPEHAQMTKL